MKKAFLYILLVFSFSSCEKVVNNLTTDNTVDGLKEALRVCTVIASEQLGMEDGYLMDETVKICLPEEAQTTFKAVKTIQSILNHPSVPSSLSVIDVSGLDADFENVLITAFNRAAEDAAPQSVEIFVAAINSMTIDDGTNILFSSNKQAATNYLAEKTTGDLTLAFSPVINESLDKVKIADYNATTAWATYATKNNQLATTLKNSVVQSGINTAVEFNLITNEQKSLINSIDVVKTDLGEYVTSKALDGLFNKIGTHEYKIRTDATARINDLLRDVFGKLDNK